MATIESKIREASVRNAELLAILSETEYAIPALEQQRRYVADLENEVKDARARIDRLDIQRKKELKEHENYRDSVMRRFAFKISGKKEQFEQNAAKEEREYFEVLQKAHQAKEMKTKLDLMLKEARGVRENLQSDVAKNQQARRELDSLYDSVFQGPSPGYPEEDEKERVSEAALQDYHNARVVVEQEQQVHRILVDAQTMMRRALMSMQDALGASRMDMYGGGSFTDMMERNALHQAEMELNSVRMMVAQAQRLSPTIQSLPPVHIAQGHLMSDVFFDNIFTDMAFHDKIKQSNLEVERCADSLNWNLQQARTRHMETMTVMDQKAKVLEEARLALQKARKEAFERIAADSQIKD